MTHLRSGALFACLLASCCSVAPGEPASVAPSTGPFREEFARLGERYGLVIDWRAGPLEEEHRWGRRSARNAADWELQAYAPILVEELGRYPRDAIERSGLKRVIVCRDLWVESQGVNQNVSGTLDYGTATLYLCVSYTYKVNNRAKQRRVVHHALYHQFDHVMGLLREDAEWSSLNAKGFEYGAHGPGGQHDRSSEAGLLTTRYPGFVNRYSTGNLADDKADMFAYMVVLHHWVADRARSDPVVAAKMQLVRRRLERFCPELGVDFWAAIRATRRPVTPYVTP